MLREFRELVLADGSLGLGDLRLSDVSAKLRMSLLICVTHYDLRRRGGFVLDILFSCIRKSI